MLPNLFLKTFWQMSLRPQIFVAMSFADTYKRRFDNVIAPAIRGIMVDGVQLEPYRVDFSKSGDSILTDIMDGIAHCQMVLADVSIMGHDSKNGNGYRNGNVMYEVGLAAACRQSTELLLVRDDKERFLFDISTIPHVTIDFTDEGRAMKELQEALSDRLKERTFLNDARVRKAVASLTDDELQVIQLMGQPVHAPPTLWGFPSTGSVNFLAMSAIPRLFDKQMIELGGKQSKAGGFFRWTQLGWIVVQSVLTTIPTYTPNMGNIDSSPA